MGVRKLHAWVARRYPYVILRKLRRTIKFKPKPQQRGERVEQQSKEIPLRIAGLHIDGNACIHEAAQWVHGYGKFERNKQGIADNAPQAELDKRKDATPELVAERFLFLIEEAMILVKPSQRLYIAIDGAAPLAKAQQQRTRRFLAAARATSEDDEEARQDIEEGETPIGMVGVFDSSVISPGTPFMDKVDERIRKWLRDNVATLPRDTKYYSHRTPGEGEHKLLDALSTGHKSRGGMAVKSGKIVSKGRNEYDVIYGNDNDLIVLTLARTQQTLILRDAMDRVGDIELIRNPPELGRFELVDVDVLRDRLHKDYDITPADFSVAILLLGNDFVPTTPIGFEVYTTIDMALGIYSALKKHKHSVMSKRGLDVPFVLFDDKMHWDDLYAFITEFVRGEREGEMLLRRYETEIRSASYTRKIEPTTSLHNAVSMISGKTSINVEQYREAYWKEIFPGAETSPVYAELMLDVVDAYLEAFVWSTTYYILGVQSVNVEWYCRYHYAPMLREVSIALESFKEMPIRWERLPLDRSGKFLNPLELEIAILPLHVLNTVLYGTAEFTDELLNKVFNPLRDLYPETVKIDGEGHDIPDKAIVRLPFVDAVRVREVAKSLHRSDVAAVERRPIVFPFAEQISGKTKTGRSIKQSSKAD